MSVAQLMELVSERVENGVEKEGKILTTSIFPYPVFSRWPFRSWDEKFTKTLKKSSLYSKNLLIFIHETAVVESHPTTRGIRDLLRPRTTPMGNTVYFYTSSLLIYILEIHRRSFKNSVQGRHYGK